MHHVPHDHMYVYVEVIAFVGCVSNPNHEHPPLVDQLDADHHLHPLLIDESTLKILFF